MRCAFPGLGAFYDARGQAVPFRYADGGGEYVTSRKPVTVVLAHGAPAYLLVAKYRCDLGIARNAAEIQLTLPAAHGQAFAAREPVGFPARRACPTAAAGRGTLASWSPFRPSNEPRRQPAACTKRQPGRPHPAAPRRMICGSHTRVFQRSRSV
jgi:hypothetical protein